jgi:hypothetical protein
MPLSPTILVLACSTLIRQQNQLALSPSSGISAQPLYSIQQTTNDVTNTVLGSAYDFATNCNGLLYLSAGTGAVCIQVILNPTYNPISYTTTTITSGSVYTARTVVPNGYTVTQGGTVTAVVPIATCTATGIAYTAYTNPYPYPAGSAFNNPDYIGFNSSYFNRLSAASALFFGVTSNINFDFTSDSGPLYGTTARTHDQTAIVYTGYFVPPVSGSYTLSFSAVDDVAYFWMGAAVTTSTWGEFNFNGRGTYYTPGKGSIRQIFTAGELYPIVILNGNGAQRAAMQFSILTPAGTTVIDTTSYFLQPICGNSGLSTTTNQPTTIVSCAATGIQYANRPAPTSTTAAPAPLIPLLVAPAPAAAATFNPDNYSSATAAPYTTVNFRGITDNLSFGVASPGTSAIVYGYGPYDLTQSGTFLRGYFVPSATGNYTFSLNQPYDVGYMWIGLTAISGSNSANAVTKGVTVAGTSEVYTTTLTAGVLTPLHLAFGNAGGAMSYSSHVLDPTGVTKTDSFGWLCSRGVVELRSIQTGVEMVIALKKTSRSLA